MGIPSLFNSSINSFQTNRQYIARPHIRIAVSHPKSVHKGFLTDRRLNIGFKLPYRCRNGEDGMSLSSSVPEGTKKIANLLKLVDGRFRSGCYLLEY
jgi:hypothetical protein